MPNQELAIRRKPPLTQGLPDTGVDTVAAQIAGLLPGPVTVQQVETALKPHHKSVQGVQGPMLYAKVYDPVTGTWSYVCYQLSIVTVTDSETERPIEVVIEDSM